MFDELLNPDIEELIPVADGIFSGSLKKSQPVTLTCNGVAVAYDGYYDPSGNNISWALGPSLFIQPLMFNNPDAPKNPPPFTVAAGSECQVALKPDVVVDKDGNKVPTDQLGPFKFKLANLALTTSAPAANLKDPTKPVTLKAATPVIVSFNAPVQDGSLTAAEVTITEVASCTATTGVVHPAAISVDADDPESFDIAEDDAGVDAMNKPEAWLHAKTFIITFNAGANVEDVAGATAVLPGADKFTICFKTESP